MRCVHGNEIAVLLAPKIPNLWKNGPDYIDKEEDIFLHVSGCVLCNTVEVEEFSSTSAIKDFIDPKRQCIAKVRFYSSTNPDYTIVEKQGHQALQAAKEKTKTCYVWDIKNNIPIVLRLVDNQWVRHFQEIEESVT